MILTRDRKGAIRLPHKEKIVGANPAPATNQEYQRVLNIYKRNRLRLKRRAERNGSYLEGEFTTPKKTYEELVAQVKEMERV